MSTQIVISRLRSLYLLCVFAVPLTTLAAPPAPAKPIQPPISKEPVAKAGTQSKEVGSKPTVSGQKTVPAASSNNKSPVIPTPPQVAAGAWVLIDASTGQVFAENNADTRMEPASLTKIMTAYVVFDALHSGERKLTDLVRVSERAWKTGGSRTFLDLNSQVPLETVVLGMVIQSGNDASVALAEHIAGTEAAFSDLMNHHAQQIGMVNTHFDNATGLPDVNHYSSARDLALLSKSLIQRFPNEYKWFSTKEFTYHGILQHNRDVLLTRDSSVDGIKTGFTDRAGYCLISSAKREDMRLISVVLNTKSPAARAREAQSLLDYGFRFWETRRVYIGRQPLTTTRVWKGAVQELEVGTAEDVYVTIPRGQYKNVKTDFEVQDHILAPLEKLKTVGTAHITLPDGKLQDYPLAALSEVSEGNLWRKLVDTSLLLFK